MQAIRPFPRPRWRRPRSCSSWRERSHAALRIDCWPAVSASDKLEWPAHTTLRAQSTSSLPREIADESSIPPQVDDSKSSKAQGKRPAVKGAFKGALLKGVPGNPGSLGAINRALSDEPDRAPLTKLHFAHSEEVVRYLADLMNPLEFDEELACRMVTAKSAAKANVEGRGFVDPGTHNAKLSFLGRRMLHFAMSSFLASAPTDQSLVDPQSSPSLAGRRIDRVLDSRLALGAFVGRAWGLEKIMRWREVAASRQTVNGTMLGTGLYSARGEAVEAIMGGIMSRHGTRLALAVFHSRLLPYIAHRLGPEYEVTIEAVRQRDEDLVDSQAGLGSLADLPLEEIAEQFGRRSQSQAGARVAAAA